MSTERDELENIIAERYHATRPTPTVLDSAIAGAILAAGYRKPQQVTTEEELGAAISAAFEDARPLVVSDRAGRPWIIWEDENGDAWVESWPQEEDPERLTLADITLPATVLHVGGAE